MITLDDADYKPSNEDLARVHTQIDSEYLEPIGLKVCKTTVKQFNKPIEKIDKYPQRFLNLIKSRGLVSRLFCAEYFNVSREASWAVLKRLCNEGHIERVGEGINTQYRPVGGKLTAIVSR